MSKSRKLILILAIVISVITILIFNSSDNQDEIDSAQSAQNLEKQQKKGVLKNFTGQEFRDLHDSVAYPNSTFINEKTFITTNHEADAKIRDIAISRGYKQRSAPVANNFVKVSSSEVLQPLAAKNWFPLKKAANKDGVDLIIIEGYRSAKDQRTIFLDRLGGISLQSIAAGKADSRVDTILQTTALPGYSRHHTGYTIDLTCKNDPNVVFEKSKCFEWLSKDNYKNAKTYGWIPSYPDNAGKQGPEPEAWEYVWVGKDLLTD